jgi:putative Holliday junction resolvase
MPRILAIDYGRKRSGLAVTDPSQMISTGLDVVESKNLLSYLADYFSKEKVEAIVVGEPKTLSNEKSESAKYIEPFLGQLRKKFPQMKVLRYDERFTSVIAKQTMISGGVKKMDRRNKSKYDLISAIVILQDFMNHRQNFPGL